MDRQELGVELVVKYSRVNKNATKKMSLSVQNNLKHHQIAPIENKFWPSYYLFHHTKCYVLIHIFKSYYFVNVLFCSHVLLYFEGHTADYIIKYFVYF